MFYLLEKNKPVLEVPETSTYITHFLPSASNSLILSSPDKPQESSPTISLPPLLDSWFHELGYLGASSSQPGFNSVGEILKILLYNLSPVSGESDLRGKFRDP